MSEEDKKWLKQEFPKNIKGIIRGPQIEAYYKAEMLLNGSNKINKRGCSCQLGSMKKSVEDKYNRWLQNEKNISE